MNLTAQQKRICEQVVNVFETGSTDGDYSNISIYNDGPNDIRQITYGRSQTTEYGNLHELVDLYASRNGLFSDKLRPFITKIGIKPLVDDKNFKQLLRDAGKNDPLMRQVQDEFFDKVYFQRAMRWADDNGFTRPLSALVIYDSWIHSGSILDFLRRRFPAVPPAQGGTEEDWIKQYVETRQKWLASASNKALHATVYRTRCLLNEIGRGNWDLSQLPIKANGVNVSGQ